MGVVLEMVDDLLVILRRNVLKTDSLREGFPLEVEHRVEGRRLYPPVTPLHCLFYEARVVPWHDNILETVVAVDRRKRDLLNLLLR